MLTEETGQDRFDPQDLAIAYVLFRYWLTEHAGEDAAKCFQAIWNADKYNYSFLEIPESMIPGEEDREIIDIKKELACAIKWLYEQD